MTVKKWRGFWVQAFFKSIYVFLVFFFINKNTSVSALEIDIGGGEISGSFDTTISAGASWRVEKRDKDLIGLYNGGNNYHVNGDDGNLNYDRGLVSQVTKVLHELDLNYRNYGFFGRVNYFYDSENANKDELSGDAKEEIGAHVDILDAYFTGDFDMWERFLNIRLGNQVLSWGESSFIQNGINIINPVNVSMLRSPGSELKDALIPVPMVSVSYEIMKNVNIEGFYMFTFMETEIDPPGTYFSVSDIVGDGGEVLWLGPEGTFGAGIPREDRDTSEGGQHGFACHVFIPPLNNTECGLFYVNYHSRLPVLSLRTGTMEGLEGNDYAGSSRYIIEYPEDIHLFGTSFNAMLGNSGIAIQGEFSFRPNMPLQLDDTELANALFTPLNSFGGAYESQLGSYMFDEEIRGYKTHKVGQGQFSMSKIFGPENPFQATSIVVMGEAGFTHVYDMKEKGSLKYDGPETSHADSFSWGYVLMTQLSYANAIGAVKLLPSAAFSHDVHGITPGPIGNFLQNRKAISLGLGASYLERWQANIGYTRYFGAEDLNVINDRDFITFDLKYFF